MNKKMTDLTTDLEPVGQLAPIKQPGPAVPVRRDGRTRWLQDGRWVPGWLVWWRRHRHVVLAASVILGVGMWVLARLLAGTGR